MSRAGFVASVRGTVHGVTAAVGLALRAAPWTALGFLVVSFLTAGLPVVTAWLTKLVLDRIAGPDRDVAGLVPLAVGLAGIGLTALATPPAVRYLRAELMRAVGLSGTDRLYGAVNRLPGLARFEDPSFLDRLRLAAQSGGNASSQVFDGSLSMVSSMITIVGFVGSLIVISPVMTVAVLLAAVPALVAELLLARRRAAMFWRIGPKQRLEMFYGTLLADEQAAKEIRLFGLGTFFRSRMLAQRRAANAEQRRVDRRELITLVLLAVLSATVAGAGLVWAVRAAASRALTPGDVMIFVAAVAGVQAGLSQLAGQVALTHQQLLLFEHYLAVLRAEPDLPVAAAPVPVPALRSGIELRDVWFRYSAAHPWVLRGVDMVIPHGRAVALVGRNGAGKSTLVKLLCRFYDPTRGAVLWDGVDIRDFDPAELRERIGAVFQDYMRYDLTAAENIGVGDLGVLDDAGHVRAAADRAGIHPALAALPRGYDTLLSRTFFVGADTDSPAAGVVLSGGQWQRVALARALLRYQRDLLILDEPSSGLDAEAEYEVHSRLRTHRSGRTSLLISHRLGAVRDADTIVVLDEGRVAETGSHDELLGTGGIYGQLFTMQAEGYQAVATVTS